MYNQYNQGGHQGQLPAYMRPSNQPMAFSPTDTTSDTQSTNLSQVSSSSSKKFVRFDPTKGTTKETVIGDDSPSPVAFQAMPPTYPNSQPALITPTMMHMQPARNTTPVSFGGASSTHQIFPSNRSTSTTVRTAESTDGLVNAKVVSTVYPEKGCCVWCCPPTFDPMKMPKSLMETNVVTARRRPDIDVQSHASSQFYHTQQMPVEDYVQAMETLTRDSRFSLYCTMYRRFFSIWFVIWLIVLAPIIYALAGSGFVLFGAIIGWLFILALGLLGCLMIKRSIHKGLHRAVARTNEIIYKYDLLIGVDDKGTFSCQKVASWFPFGCGSGITIHWVYFHLQDCLPRVAQMIQSSEEQRHEDGDRRAVRYQVPRSSAEIQGRSNAKAVDLVLKYSQSYIKAILRRRLRFPTRPAEGVSELMPLHCAKHYCMCQFILKRHFQRKKLPFYEKYFYNDDLTIAELESQSNGNRTPNSFYPQTVQYVRN